MSSPLDLRSDTVTRPTAAMRAAMAQAEVGDDVYGEDPTALTLEERIAALCGKEAAIFVPSGTLGNQLALLVQTQRGDEVIIGEGAHCAWYESGAGAAIAGVQFVVAGRGGFFSAAEMEAVRKPDAFYYPRTSLVALENTHNRAGGRCWPAPLLDEVARAAHAAQLALHLDGARLWNVSAAQGRSMRELCAPFDTVNVCFSKGLGAPVGSALLGSKSIVREAHRWRKRMGAGMRQVGILAAAALYALDNHLDRLVEDHANALTFARTFAQSTIVSVDLTAVETNIVNLHLPGLSAQQVADAAYSQGLLINATGPHSLRAVFHLDFPAEQVPKAAEILLSVTDAMSRSSALHADALP